LICVRFSGEPTTGDTSPSCPYAPVGLLKNVKVGPGERQTSSLFCLGPRSVWVVDRRVDRMPGVGREPAEGAAPRHAVALGT
jgi:hypothetical protein